MLPYLLLRELLSSLSSGGFKRSLWDAKLRNQRLLSSGCPSGHLTHATLELVMFANGVTEFTLTSRIKILSHLWTARLILNKPLLIWRKN